MYFTFISYIKYNFSFFLLLCMSSLCFAHHEGFSSSTLVKIATQEYVPIEQLCVGDYILTYNFETQEQEQQPIIAIEHEHISQFIRFNINDYILDVAPEQSFYIPLLQQWMIAQQLCDNPLAVFMLCSAIKDVKVVEHDASVIKITLAHNHTFYVTDHDLLAHNYAQPVLLCTGVGFSGPAAPAAVTAISIGCIGYYAYQFFKGLKYKWQCRNAHCHTSCSSNIQKNATARATNNSPAIQNNIALAKQQEKQTKLPVPLNNNNQQPSQNPEDPENKVPFWVKKALKGDVKRLTNKMARAIASALGYQEVKNENVPATIGELVFKSGNKYITRDLTSHKGGLWKMYEYDNGRWKRYTF